MSKQQDWIIDLITKITGDKITARLVIEALMEEGLLKIGYGDGDVDIIVEKFVNTFGATKVTRYDRFAAKRLATKYGSPTICSIIQLLDTHREDKYVPVVRSITQLEEKIVSIIAFLRKVKGVETID